MAILMILSIFQYFFVDFIKPNPFGLTENIILYRVHAGPK